jgi:hypothetical protein
VYESHLGLLKSLTSSKTQRLVQVFVGNAPLTPQPMVVRLLWSHYSKTHLFQEVNFSELRAPHYLVLVFDT